MHPCRQDSPVGDRIAQSSAEDFFPSHNSEKFVVSFHDKALHELALFRVIGRAPFSMSLNFPLLKTTEASPTLLNSARN